MRNAPLASIAILQIYYHRRSFDMSKISPIDPNEALKSLYRQAKPRLARRIHRIVDSGTCPAPSNPLLLWVPDVDRYLSADIRVMFFGQETNEWFGEFGSRLDSLMTTYEGFFGSQIGVYEGERYPGSFWNGLHEYANTIEDLTKCNVQFMWNNLVKVGQATSKGKPCDQIIDAGIEAFDVIPREIEILEPDIVIFFTGPNYDSIIDRVFPGTEYTRINNHWDSRQLAVLESPALPPLSFRTYHPNFLYRHTDRRNSIRDAITRRIVRERER
jgi:hypothetical protein